ncbi:MAG: hypothetical protein R3E91_01160 [Chlamydiales bacterium]
MNNSLSLTIVISIILMGCVVFGLGIGLFFTGKSKLNRGCGRPQEDKKNGRSCSICQNEKDVCKKNK